ncbi:hypothetical protein ACLKA7_014110 [Drosophila subpalustris]
MRVSMEQSVIPDKPCGKWKWKWQEERSRFRCRQPASVASNYSLHFHMTSLYRWTLNVSLKLKPLTN